MRWRDYLRRIDAELAIPYPERARFLDELNADLDAAFQRQRSAGLDENAAEQATLREAKFGQTVQGIFGVVY